MALIFVTLYVFSRIVSNYSAVVAYSPSSAHQHPQVLADVASADAVVYAMGSLYTSIGPNLILQGVGEAVAASGAAKILILNGTHDRETGCCARTGEAMAASGTA